MTCPKQWQRIKVSRLLNGYIIKLTREHAVARSRLQLSLATMIKRLPLLFISKGVRAFKNRAQGKINSI